MLEGTATEERRNEIHKKMRSRTEEIEIIINLLLHQPIRHRHNGERGAQHDNDEKKGEFPFVKRVEQESEGIHIEVHVTARVKRENEIPVGRQKQIKVESHFSEAHDVW